jgi:putative flippase GtrA
VKRAEPINLGAMGLMFKGYAKFCVVGGTGLVVDMASIYLL